MAAVELDVLLRDDEVRNARAVLRRDEILMHVEAVCIEERRHVLDRFRLALAERAVVERRRREIARDGHEVVVARVGVDAVGVDRAERRRAAERGGLPRAVRIRRQLHNRAAQS